MNVTLYSNYSIVIINYTASNNIELDRSSSLAQASRDEDTHGSRAYNNGINTQGLNERKGPLLRKIHNVHMQVLAVDEMNDPNSSIRSISPVRTIENNGRSTSPVRIDK